ncbi:Di-copper centre-containing protein [Xylariomycetidae sp. FL2044]|nr:Di-copper centre-containing protein [Xylariomycetidae sp. FL2044]
MRSNNRVLALLAATVPSATAYNPASTLNTDALAEIALTNLASYSASFSNQTTCTLETATKRREWGDLTLDERVAYTDAVLCLMSTPSIYNSTEVPGAKTRYDDFVVPHMNLTKVIHQTANFLSWHRYFVYTYEKALQEECGYAGTQPYWNWGRWALDPLDSPLLDGGAGSMSGNGAYEFHNCTDGLGNGLSCIPAAAGGGCVTSGPFANYTVNLGPIDNTLAEAGIVNVDSTFDWNPRCMKRDVNSWVSSRWSTEQNTTDLIVQNLDIESFQDVMQGNATNGDYGVHGAGHYTYTGDPAGDVYISPADPMFFLHHAQIDRTWWIWQNQDPAERTSAIAGTITMDNDPPSRDGTLEDMLAVGLNGDQLQMALAMSTVGTTGGPFCYVYA